MFSSYTKKNVQPMVDRIYGYGKMTILVSDRLNSVCVCVYVCVYSIYIVHMLKYKSLLRRKMKKSVWKMLNFLMKLIISKDEF